MKPTTWHNFTSKSNTPLWVFYTFFKLYHGTKSSNASHKKLFLTLCKLYKPLLELEVCLRQAQNAFSYFRAKQYTY